MPKLRLDDGMVTFACPGCNERHSIYVEQIPDFAQHPVWSYNGNPEAPTFTPSVLVSWNQADPPVTMENWAEWRRQPWPQRQLHKVCHSFVTDGRIEFLSDSTHKLAGTTVDLPEWSPT